MTCKWLINMVIVSPLNGVVPLANGLNGLQMGVTNYLLAGMILQAHPTYTQQKKTFEGLRVYESQVAFVNVSPTDLAAV